MCSISLTSFLPFPRSAEIDHLIAKEHVMNEQQVSDEHAFNEVIAVLERRAAAEALATLAAGVVDADLQRCHRALARLRNRRLVTRSAAGLVAAAAAVTALQMGGSPSHANRFGASTEHSTAGAPATAPTAVRLVAYTGNQPRGFTLASVPQGWHLDTDDSYRVWIAPRINPPVVYPAGVVGGPTGDPTREISVGLASPEEAPPTGTPVMVGSVKGLLASSTQVPGYPEPPFKTLTFTDRQGHHVDVAVPDSAGLTTQQILDFGAGIQVTDQVKIAHG
jgi:hypothetical protein